MNKKNKKLGFTLVELMIFFLFISLILAATAPMITKKVKELPRRFNHGMFMCYRNEDGQLVEEYYNSSGLIDDRKRIITEEQEAAGEECNFTPPNRAALFKIELIGAGAGGYDYNDATEESPERIFTWDPINGYKRNSELRNDYELTAQEIYDAYKDKKIIASVYTEDAGDAGKVFYRYFPPIQDKARCIVDLLRKNVGCTDSCNVGQNCKFYKYYMDKMNYSSSKLAKMWDNEDNPELSELKEYLRNLLSVANYDNDKVYCNTISTLQTMFSNELEDYVNGKGRSLFYSEDYTDRRRTFVRDLHGDKLDELCNKYILGDYKDSIEGDFSGGAISTSKQRKGGRGIWLNLVKDIKLTQNSSVTQMQNAIKTAFNNIEVGRCPGGNMSCYAYTFVKSPVLTKKQKEDKELNGDNFDALYYNITKGDLFPADHVRKGSSKCGAYCSKNEDKNKTKKVNGDDVPFRAAIRDGAKFYYNDTVATGAKSATSKLDLKTGLYDDTVAQPGKDATCGKTTGPAGCDANKDKNLSSYGIDGKTSLPEPKGNEKLEDIRFDNGFYLKDNVQIPIISVKSELNHRTVKVGNGGAAGSKTVTVTPSIPDNCSFVVPRGGRVMNSLDESVDVSRLITSMTCTDDNGGRFQVSALGGNGPSSDRGKTKSEVYSAYEENKDGVYEWTTSGSPAGQSPYIRDNAFTSRYNEHKPDINFGQGGNPTKRIDKCTRYYGTIYKKIGDKAMEDLDVNGAGSEEVELDCRFNDEEWIEIKHATAGVGGMVMISW